MVFGARTAIAVGAAAVVILAAPFTQQGVEALGDQFGRVAIAATGVPIAIALLIALVRIRDRRALRYAALAAAVGIGVAYGWTSNVSVGESFHFAEYGVVTLLFYWACRPLGDASALVLPVIAALLAGTLDEWFQWFIPIRAGEARDVALNAVAAACGLLVGVAMAPPEARLGFGPAARSRVALWSAATAVTFALFFQSVHLGHDIVRGDIGTFRSRYTETRLADIGRERAARWSAQPPLERRRLSREDQFLTEGLWHVQERNRASSAGDLLTAWRENAILETFYTPVLDTASYSSATGHRWSPEQRVAAEAAAAAASASDRSPYVSDAYPFPLYAWPFRGF